ncbi:MAG TPA: hypothetical protein VFL57_21280, partial [Bryobacteraceae bacterium]|nr:hypothetical protein [Bryobacteraceae bacterium]
MKKLLLIIAAVLVCGSLVATAAPRPSASPQGGTAPSTMSGTLTRAGDKYFLTDTATKARVEVRGEGLAKYVGQKVS